MLPDVARRGASHCRTRCHVLRGGAERLATPTARFCVARPPPLPVQCTPWHGGRLSMHMVYRPVGHGRTPPAVDRDAQRPAPGVPPPRAGRIGRLLRPNRPGDPPDRSTHRIRPPVDCKTPPDRTASGPGDTPKCMTRRQEWPSGPDEPPGLQVSPEGVWRALRMLGPDRLARGTPHIGLRTGPRKTRRPAQPRRDLSLPRLFG